MSKASKQQVGRWAQDTWLSRVKVPLCPPGRLQALKAKENPLLSPIQTACASQGPKTDQTYFQKNVF